MTDLPYTYTELDGDSLRMFSDGPDLVVTVRQDGGARTVVVPREETPNLARAVLAAADDTEDTHTVEIQDIYGNVLRTDERPTGYDCGPVCHHVHPGPPLAENFDAGWAAGHAHARADADRLAALEQQFTDLANLVHGHGEDLARIRYRFTAEDDG